VSGTEKERRGRLKKKRLGKAILFFKRENSSQEKDDIRFSGETSEKRVDNRLLEWSSGGKGEKGEIMEKKGEVPVKEGKCKKIVLVILKLTLRPRGGGALEKVSQLRF